MRENFVKLKLTIKFEIRRERRGGVELVEGEKTARYNFQEKVTIIRSEEKKLNLGYF
jgi:hypothetical protein